MIEDQRLLDLLGPIPECAALNAQVVESVDCGSYVRERVEYNAEPNERISAFILFPKKITNSAPAVFCHHQHARQYNLGKSEVVGLVGDPSQAFARELVERGFVTLASDAIGFEERNDSAEDWRTSYRALSSRLIRGQTLLAKALHDISVGIDYLCSRDNVDTSRVGFIGHSYGGRMALWAPAFDERIRVSVSNCGCISFADSLTPDTGVQLEFCVPGILQWGDLADVVRLIAPRALLISAACDDKWSRGAAALYEQVKPAFPEGALEFAEYPGGHTFSSEMRERAYEFFERHVG